MQKRAWVLFGLSCMLNAEQPGANPQVLTVFVERLPYLEEKPQKPDAHLLKKLEDPRKLHRLIVKGHIKSRAVAGLCASYFGWWTYSDHNGQLLFPLEHEEKSVLLVVTRRILPIKAHNGVVQGFFVPQEEPVAAYKLDRHERKEKDQTLAWWSVSRYELPDKQTLLPDTLIIFAKPHHVIVPEGDTRPIVTTYNLLLPTLYVPYHVNLAVDALSITAVNRYMAPVTRVIARTAERYATIIAP